MALVLMLSTWVFLFSFPIIGIVWADGMSFNEAINAVILDKHNDLEISYEIVGNFSYQPLYFDETGIVGIFAWLAPNGTCYQLGYPNQTVLGRIAQTSSSEYNPPDGYTFWWLMYDRGTEYWIDINDGSIIHFVLQNGPIPRPSNIFSLNNLLYFVIMPIILIAVVAIPSALVIKRKNKKGF